MSSLPDPAPPFLFHTNRNYWQLAANKVAGASGILHTIFFIRFFPAILPQTRDVLGFDLAFVPEAEIETLIDQRVTSLARQLEAERNQPHHVNPHLQHVGLAGTGGSGRGQVTVQFFEKRRRRAWYSRGEDEVCWESWTVKVTVAEPRTEGGMLSPFWVPTNLPRSPDLSQS